MTYSELYKSEALDLTDINAIMDPLDLPSLSTIQAKQLDVPITLEELNSAVTSMKRQVTWVGWDTSRASSGDLGLGWTFVIQFYSILT